MKPTEQGFLLLTSPLGIPDRRTITPAQMRLLKQRIKDAPPSDPDRAMCPEDLILLGYTPEQAKHILDLLSDTQALELYLQRGEQAGCVPLTWTTPGYPKAVLSRLKADSPGSLWAKGDLCLLDMPCVALVGSRELFRPNWQFAQAVGRWAARNGYALVSGNARGSDKTAQNACLQAGGCVISVVADKMTDKIVPENMLLLSEDGFDLPFSAQRAISRNRVIHALGARTFVAQCTLGKGGTWSGVMYNLRHELSPLYCFDDGSKAVLELHKHGAILVTKETLEELT